MVKLLRLFIVLVAGFLAHSAFATVPVVNSYQCTVSIYGSPFGPASTCQAAAYSAVGGQADWVIEDCPTLPTGGYCNLKRYGTPVATSVSVVTTSACPANSSPSGSACACASGYSESGGACVLASDQKCQDVKGMSDMFSGFSAKPPVGQAFCPSSGNASSCGAIVEGGFAGKKTGQPLSWTYDIKYTGATCTPPASSASVAPTTCKGQAGIVNGVAVCIPFSSTDAVETVKSTTTTNPVSSGAEAGSSGTTTSTKESSCTGSKCTTTTTTTTTDATGIATTTTQTSDQPKEDFCAENPTSIACKEFNFGDIEASEVGNKDVQLGITKVDGFGPTSGTCPSPQVATVLGVSLVMPYTLLCEFAEKIKPLLIGFAYLSAALTFFGFARK